MEIASVPIAEASLGGASYLVALFGKLLHKKADHIHEERMEALKKDAQMAVEKIKDTQDARKYKYKFARRAIVFSLFFLIPLYGFISVLFGNGMATPISSTSNYFWGLFSFTSNDIQTFKGLFYDPKIATVYLMIAGFYFGQKTD